MGVNQGALIEAPRLNQVFELIVAVRTDRRVAASLPKDVNFYLKYQVARKRVCKKCTVKMKQIFWMWRIPFFQIPCHWTTKALLESQGIELCELLRVQNSFEPQISCLTL